MTATRLPVSRDCRRVFSTRQLLPRHRSYLTHPNAGDDEGPIYQSPGLSVSILAGVVPNATFD